METLMAKRKNKIKKVDFDKRTKAKHSKNSHTQNLMSENIKLLLPVCLIAVVTFLTFYPSTQNGFTNWDDDYYVTNNYVIKDMSWENIKRIFTTPYVSCYLPLTMLSYAIEYYFFNLNPFYYHLTNVFLHVLNSILVFILIYLLTENILVSLITSLLFGIHPLHVESVAWIAERKDVLATAFFLLAIILYIYYQKTLQVKYYLSALLVFILSLLSKAMGVTLPFVMLLVDYLANRKINKNMILDKIPFLIIALMFGAFALFFQEDTGAIKKNIISMANIFTGCYNIVFYITKILLPINLSCFYPYPAKDIVPIIFYISALILPGIIFLILLSRGYTKKILFGSLFFLITVLPVLQVIPIGQTIAADRYMYIPAIGFFYIIGEGSHWLLRRNTAIRIITQLFLVMIFIALCCLTWERCAVWKDSMTLWNDVLGKYKNEPTAYLKLGLAYATNGHIDAAINNYTKAISLSPTDAGIYVNRGLAYASKGEYVAAISDYTSALKIRPNFAMALKNRAYAYFDVREYEKAWQDINTIYSLGSGNKVDKKFLEMLKKASGIDH